MTRSRRTSIGTLTKDRHLQRNGLMDPRGMPKKKGAGQHNWGKPTDILGELDENYEYKEETPQDTKAANTNRESGRLGKVQVVKQEEFEALYRITNSG